MAFGVLAYPNLKSSDYKFIQEFRKENDELYYSIAEPHFAFVFPISSIGKTQFIAEVFDKAKGFVPFDFEIKCATVNKDSFIDYYHLLLVPDRGYSNVVKLHDRLYSDLFFSELRLDIDFIPHMGIANSKDKFRIKKMADSWNIKDFSIEGTIDKLTVIEYTNNILTDLSEIKL
jgi:hypothetical protein